MSKILVWVVIINNAPKSAGNCDENSICRLLVSQESSCSRTSRICSGSNVSCGCLENGGLAEISVSCNAFCGSLLTGSKCRIWYETPLCQATGNLCGSDVCTTVLASGLTHVPHVVPLTPVFGNPFERTYENPAVTQQDGYSTTGPGTITTSDAFPPNGITLTSSPKQSAMSKVSTTTTTSTTSTITTFTSSTSTITTTTTTSTSTTTSTTTTTTTTTASPYASCESVGSADQPIFLWAEWPSLQETSSAWTGYYVKMASFLKLNCARLRVKKLILRFILPNLGAWWPPADSPLYLALLSQIDQSTELYVYPYVMDTMNQISWTDFSPSGTNVVEGVFEFTKQWNAFLGSVNSPLRFSGVVFDYEEFNNNKAPLVFKQIQEMAALKAQYGLLTGIATGYPPTAVVNVFNNVMDQFYSEFYDYYYTPFVDSSLSSPFLIYLNDPSALSQFTLSTVLGGKSEDAALYGPKTNVMWSLQSINGSCVYPLTDGTCGINFEFGAGWTAAAVNQYLQNITSTSPNLGSLPQGFFQFSFIPISWFL